jgi:two-component system, chemotaxis family, chemotaxis protein CheY
MDPNSRGTFVSILVIDDDPVSRLALSALVEELDLGCATEFETAVAAWEHLQEAPPPLLVCCDMRMPGMNGLELLQSVRQRQKLSNTPFVLVTSATQSGIKHDAARLGVSGYIAKPFTPEETLPRLREIMDGSWANVAEHPVGTLRRLSLPTGKLEVYYAAFRQRIDEALSQIALREGLEAERFVLGQIDTLQTGCLTLGLWHGARIIDSLKTISSRKESVLSHLVAMGDTLDIQRRRFLLSSPRSEAS